MDKKYIVLHVDYDTINEDKDFQEALITYSVSSFSKHSDLGIETFEVIMELAQFAVAIIALPRISQLLEQQRITVSFGGFNMHGNWRKIVRNISNDPEAKDEFIRALHDHKLVITGESQKVLSFHNEMRKVIFENCDTESVTEENEDEDD
ncbi:MAG: hypothetical protein J6K73_15090 [Clostridia bacterium]|nr:hypothetical protein [Clostridia bacterium]